MTETLLPGNDVLENDLSIDPNKKYFEELVGENKKFKTPEDLARGKAESDQYVRHLVSRLDQLTEDYSRLREESNARARLEELIDQLPKSASSDNTNDNAKETDTSAIDMKRVEEIVASKLMESEQRKKEQENFNIVVNKLKEKFGNNYESALKQQLDTLGLSKEFVDELAKKSPVVLMKTLGLDSETTREDFQSPPHSNQRQDNFAPSVKKRDWKFYEKMRAENPKLYWDAKTTVQMHHDAQTLGESFFEGSE